VNRSFARGPTAERASVVAAGVGSSALYAVLFAEQHALASPGVRGLAPRIAFDLIATVALFAAYAWILWAFGRSPAPGGRVAILAFAFPVVFYAVALSRPPALSIDALSYVAHGAVAVDLHADPYRVPASAIAATPLGTALARYGWRPVHPVTPYGPLWTDVEFLVVRSVRTVWSRLLAIKLLGTLACLGSAALVWTILRRVHPAYASRGTLAFLWNPLIVTQVAGDGHNDGLMVLLVLAALALTLRRPVVGGLTMLGAVLTKYVPALFLPAQFVYVRRSSHDARTFAMTLATTAALGIGIAVAAFRPWWIGASTFSGLAQSGDAAGTASTVSLAREALGRVGLTALETVAIPAGVLVLIAVVVVASASVSDAPGLIRACACIGVAYLLLSPTYWPWYSILPASLTTLVPERPFRQLGFALSLGACLAAPWDVLFVRGAVDRSAFLLLTWGPGLGMVTVVSGVLSVLAIAARNGRGVDPAPLGR
jgi:alpha-1,6-mannosyltransferase